MSTKTAPSTTPSFAYQGKTSDGKSVKGVIQAPNEKSAVNRLNAQGVYPTKVEEKVMGTGLQMEIKLPGSQPKIKVKDLAVVSRQMSTMVGSGVSLVRAVRVTADQTENAALRGILQDVATQIEQGSAFSVALGRHSKVFPPIMLSLVEAGELGGFLDKALDASAENFEKSVKLQNEVKSAMTYPVVVLIIAFVAVIAMLLFIVPVFENMFADFGGSLPAPTQFLVNLSHVMPYVIVPLLVLIAAAAWWWRNNRNTQAVREKVDPIKLKVPVFGKLARLIAVSRFARNFATMSSTGVPLLQSLQIVGETSGNHVIQTALDEVQDEVRRGGAVAPALAKHEIFPEMLVQMVGIGEESGSVDTMLAKAADFYDGETETMTKQLSAMLEPIMIVLLAAILGFMIVALYMPMFSIFDSVSSM
ncbi:MAG: type II secretion system F family protein [Pseudoclavibacter sp.]